MSKFIQLLSTIPDKYILYSVWAIILIVWVVTRVPFIEQLLRDLTMALLGLLGIRRTQQHFEADTMPIAKADINIETVEATTTDKPDETNQ